MTHVMAFLIMFSIVFHPTATLATERERVRERVIDAAQEQVGTPYSWGAASPGSGFDCSGLTMWVWARVGEYLSHNAAAQANEVPLRRDAERGDLLFFYSPIGHVALYLGHGMMIHASNSGVQYDPVYWGSLTKIGRPLAEVR